MRTSTVWILYWTKPQLPYPCIVFTEDDVGLPKTLVQARQLARAYMIDHASSAVYVTPDELQARGLSIVYDE
jgi:hypothetical protein